MVWESGVNFDSKGSIFVSSENWGISNYLSSSEDFFSTSSEDSFILDWVDVILVIEVSSMIDLSIITISNNSH
jgi:hypothetical protein